MTLTTRLRLSTWTEPMQLHQWVNDELLQYEDEQNIRYKSSPGEIANEPGQGLAALFKTLHNHRDPMPVEGDEPPAFVELWFDSPYSLLVHAEITPSTEGEEPEIFQLTCGMLIAGFIHKLHYGYFQPRGIEFMWNADFDEEWWKGGEFVTKEDGQPSYFVGYPELRQNEEEALAWYESRAKLMMEAEAAMNGGVMRYPSDEGIEAYVVKRVPNE